MRPNLMSPRRTATSGEDSILAMLEREPARKRKAGTSGIRLAWYGASATLALALTGTLIWMAANNDGLRPEVQESVLAEAEQAPRRNAPAPGDSPAGAATILQVAMAPAAAAPDTQSAGAALIVDQAPPAETVPPLRLLKSAPDKPAAETATPPARATTVAPLPAAAVPPRSVAKASAPARPVAPAAETRPVPRPAAAPAKSRQVVVAKSAVKPAQAKTQRGVNPARSPEAPVDADVALISAVIVHANGHAPEGSQMTELLCPNNACQSRPPSQ
ncbi:hypothetical protein [Massilia sp. BHUDP2]|uniref:hypothetical protein n=1 Tax=Massilia sp. BHUDP2 TaxID=3034505 RepID=UPI003906A8E1